MSQLDAFLTLMFLAACAGAVLALVVAAVEADLVPAWLVELLLGPDDREWEL